jgi:hypothetical protein
MGLGIPKDLLICGIIALFYGYGTRSFFNGLLLFVIYYLCRAVFKFLTEKSK